MPSIVSGPTPSHSKTAPLRKRSGTSLSGSTRTSPRTPCGPWISPTTSASSLIDLEVDLCPIACGHDLEERTDGLRDPAAAADDLTDIALGDAKMQLDEVTIELLGDRDGGGVVDQLLCDMLEHVAHAPVALRAPDRLGHRAARGTSASGRPLRTRSERAVAVGRAPFLIQWRARSASTTRSAGSVRGL